MSKADWIDEDIEALIETATKRNHHKSTKAEGRKQTPHAKGAYVDSNTTRWRKELADMKVHVPNGTLLTLNRMEAVRHLRKELVTTWNASVEKILTYCKFTVKQLKFLRHYAISGCKSRAESMIWAGYLTQHSSNLSRFAGEILKKDGADELIQAFILEERAKMGLRVEDVAKWFENIATKAMDAGDYANANRAMENYAKYLGMFVEKKEIVHKVLHNKSELDARINELQGILREEMPSIERNLTIN